MPVPTRNNLILEVVANAMHRGFRHAMDDTSGFLQVSHILHNVATPNDSTKTFILLAFDTATLSTLNEKAFSLDHPVVPAVGRV
jgi:hypothetical protein